MFGLLRRKSSLHWSPRDRLIFHFHDGRRVRKIDPLVIQRSLQEIGGEGWQDLILQVDPRLLRMAGGGSLAKQAWEMRTAAIGKLAGIVREVFAIADVPSGGLTDAECLELFGAYLRFMNAIGERAFPLPLPPSVTGPQSSAGESTMPIIAASSSGQPGTATIELHAA